MSKAWLLECCYHCILFSHYIVSTGSWPEMRLYSLEISICLVLIHHLTQLFNKRKTQTPAAATSELVGITGTIFRHFKVCVIQYDSYTMIYESYHGNLFRLNPENIMLTHTLMHRKIKQWMYRPMYVSLTDRSKINSNRPVPGGPGILDFSRKNKSRLFLMKFKVEFYEIVSHFITF